MKYCAAHRNSLLAKEQKAKKVEAFRMFTKKKA